jgi:hypothetical protein
MIGHGVVRPYKDETGNYVVLVFCVVDLLGIFSTGNGPIVQYIYIVTTIIVLLFVLALVLKSIRHTMKEEKLTDITNKVTFTFLERILLFPFLVLFVWPVKKVIIMMYPILLLSAEEQEWALGTEVGHSTRDETRDGTDLQSVRTWGVSGGADGSGGGGSKSGGSGNWTCSSCSMQNQDKELVCAICFSPKPRDNPGGKVGKEPSLAASTVVPLPGGVDRGNDGGSDRGGGDGSTCNSIVIKKKHHHHHHHHKSKKDKTKVVPI